MEDQLHIEYQAIERLTPYARNARTHSRAQIRQVADSIRAFGFINPVIVDGDGTLIAGHARLLAAKSLGLAAVPTIRVEHLSEAERRAYILADNKIAENAGWDPELLRVELEFLSRIDIDVDVDLTGFAPAEVDLLLTPGPTDAWDATAVPPLPAASGTVTQLGDVWQLGPHRLICGDCRDPAVLERLLDGVRAAAVFTDPPYNVPISGHVCGKGRYHHDEFAMASGELSSEAFEAFLAETLGALAKASLPGAVHFCCMDWRHLPELLGAGQQVYDTLLNLCVWAKTNGGMGSLYRSQHELILVYRVPGGPHRNNVELGSHGRYRTNVWSYAGANSFGADRDATLALHPTVKPLALVADALLDVTRRGDAVLDGFLGSGTTLLAAERTGRVGYGIELDPRYVDVTLQRWLDLTGEQPVQMRSGEPFAVRREGLLARVGAEVVS